MTAHITLAPDAVREALDGIADEASKLKAHGDLARGDGPRYDNGTVEAVSRG